METTNEKKMPIVNSQEYWNIRFNTDWKTYNGDEQTKFFATIMKDMLPSWLIHDINENSYEICDLGCAEGDALPIYHSVFVTSKLYGEDFSESAIKAARNKYSQYCFNVSNILEPKDKKKYPVIVCSNVVEHFPDTCSVLTSICDRAEKYVVILIPYREELGKINEHEKSFHTSNIFLSIKQFSLVYAKSIQCDSMYYPYEQILLIYAKDKKYSVLSDVSEYVSSDAEEKMIADLEKKYHIEYEALDKKHVELQNQHMEQKQQYDKLKMQRNEQQEQYAKLQMNYSIVEKKLEDKKKRLEEIREEVDKLKKQRDEQQEQYTKLQMNYSIVGKKLEDKENRIEEIREEVDKLKKQRDEQQEQYTKLQMNYSIVEKKLEDKENRIEEIREEVQKKIDEHKIELNQKEENLEQIKALSKKKENLISELKKQEQLNNEKIDFLNRELKEKKEQIEKYINSLECKDQYIFQAQELCDCYATAKLMKLNHLVTRVYGQVLHGKKEDKKEFWSWIRGKATRTNTSIGEGIRFNPLMVVRSILKEALICNPEKAIISISDEVVKEEDNKKIGLPQITREILQKNYTKYDVIILSVIDYDFRYQRPQHFAARFASNGHRVFYVNANFIRPDRIVQEKDNLYIVDFLCDGMNAIYGMDGKAHLEWMKNKLSQLVYTQGISDAIIIVDYPNWVYGAEFMKKHYGFKLVTDYMDDYTGFLGTTEDFLKDNCIELLKKSDLVAASSQFLYDIACKYIEKEKIEIIRNGTEVDHFYKAVELQENHERKVIGYYGAVAHWFAWEKICYLAKEMPECDIVIVGAVTEYKNKFEKYSNITLLGEKPYKELPKYLANFDVCLIPFDTSTDLIKATNPVKFYEYLSAGKKIVATEIPELMPYQDEYVYMSNDDEQFMNYVKMCLEGTDTLITQKECIQFAKENDWQKRFEQLETACTLAHPMISIVVLTYNNLKLNKACISSILNKTAYGNYELIIVDNASTDGTREYLCELKNKDLLNVKILLNDVNSGFAGGNNLGMKEAQGEYILLLNNDTLVTRGWLTNMLKHLENNDRFAMCNPVTNSIGNESMIQVQYTNKEEMDEFSYNWTHENMNREYRDADRLPLFATMIKKSVIDKVGMLDNAYKIGMFEDDDFTEAVKKAGYEIVIADDVFIHHVNNASFKKLSDEQYKKIFEENKEIFEKKWNKKWSMPHYRHGITANCNVGTGVTD